MLTETNLPRFGIRSYSLVEETERRIVNATLEYIRNYIEAAKQNNHARVAEHGSKAYRAVDDIQLGSRPYPKVSRSKESLITWAFDVARMPLHDVARIGKGA